MPGMTSCPARNNIIPFKHYESFSLYTCYLGFMPVIRWCWKSCGRQSQSAAAFTLAYQDFTQVWFGSSSGCEGPPKVTRPKGPPFRDASGLRTRESPHSVVQNTTWVWIETRNMLEETCWRIQTLEQTKPLEGLLMFGESFVWAGDRVMSNYRIREPVSEPVNL